MAANCRYDDAPPWEGGRNCAGGILPGTEALGDALVRNFGGSYGGFSCRPNTANEDETSVHGTGRAVDWFPPSKSAGDAGAAWLVANHIKFGIQLVIWWHEDWQCDQGWTGYSGPNPHTDHVHVEETIFAAQNNTAATYTKEMFTVSQYTEIREAIARNGRMNKEATVAQARLTRDYVDKRLDILQSDQKKLTAVEIAAIRNSVESNADEIMAKIDEDNPEPPITEPVADG